MIWAGKFNHNRILTLIFISASSIFTACAPPAGNTVLNTNVNNNPINTNANANANVARPSENKETSFSMPVTLPVLDAMLGDEQFAGEIKNKLQLTDEELDRLKQASRTAVQNLSEDETGDSSASTRSATERAATEIKKIIGDEKADRLSQMIRERWQGGAENANSTKASQPNAVPTDTRVVVNAPAYRMDIFQDGKLVKSYKIGIGYPEFPLPSGERKAETIIFNPTWTPPDEPWVKGKVQPGKTVEAGSKLNPLGPIKIPIGLPSLIHGGKNPVRLGTFASHGCVGLTDGQIKTFALDLAGIGGSDLTQEKMNELLKDKTETKNVKMGKPVAVELRYETIVVENGALKIYRDVYERGTNTEENLRKVLEVYGVALDNLKPEDREKILDGLKQMAYDAQGNPVAETPDSNSNAANNKNQNSKSDKVTKTIKGKKEVAFQLAELQGKGYPAPVNMVNQ